MENVQRCPMGGIDGCILLLNELYLARTYQHLIEYLKEAELGSFVEGIINMLLKV